MAIHIRKYLSTLHYEMLVSLAGFGVGWTKLENFESGRTLLD